jgi:ribonuclease I
MNSQYDLIAALKSKNIVPSNSKNYTVDEINSALYSYFKAPEDSIRLECEGVNHVPHLLAIDICFDINYKIITCKCDSKISNPCNPSKEVLIPLFSIGSEEIK